MQGFGLNSRRNPMKHLTVALVFAVAFPVFAQPAHDHQHRNETQAKTSGVTTHRAVGVVKSVDAAKNKVMIRHEPVQSLKWPAMTMAFQAKDAKTLDALKSGAQVSFEFEQRGSAYVVTAVNPAWGSCKPDCSMN
jgi:Cu(I)/Ag(I) efflux system protein CusF